MTTTQFPPHRDAALARLEAVRPSEYARSPNALKGAVTRLSPYVSHGVLTLPEVHEAMAAGLFRQETNVRRREDNFKFMYWSLPQPTQETLEAFQIGCVAFGVARSDQSGSAV
jgi:deoxyribodipyrimidine photolyase